MVQQIVTVVTLGVSDVARSRGFYADGLGWPVVLDVPGEVCFLQVGHGLVLSLYSAADQDRDSGSGPSTGPGNVVPACNVGSDDEVLALTERFRDAGATVLVEPRRAAWGGYYAFCADPDGIRWEIAHNAGLVTAPDGRVTIGPA
ncbi:MAG: VOC family protein [Mycobacteriales bacterium]|nr:VOC family protein [Mycobacteriales bacterium]